MVFGWCGMRLLLAFNLAETNLKNVESNRLYPAKSGK
jgi:hypothetical protein